MTNKLDNLRETIDSLDEQIQALITQRAKIAEDVAKAKQTSGDHVFYRAEREAQVLRKVMARNSGPLSDEEMARLFREIMSACLAVEQVMTIAFLGPEGTFTQAAALKHFGHSVRVLPMTSIADVFREVESGAASYGVVPVENSTEGVITHTLDEFMRSSLKICGEVELRIHHHLQSCSGRLEDIKKIYSHQQSLGQCRHWLDTHLPGIPLQDVGSNAHAAEMAAADSEAAAIAGEAAAEIYGLKIVSASIEDEPDNTTRFLVIGKRATPVSGKDKTSLLVYTDNKSGALYAMLEPIARNGLSMTRIESRPSRQGMWNYVFFIDVEGHANDEKVMRALEELSQTASMVKVLGAYPQAVL